MRSALRRGAAPVQEPVRAIGGVRTMESRGAPARRRHLIGSALLTPLLPRAPLRKWLLLLVFDFVRVRRPRPPPMCGDRAFASGASLPLSSPLLLAPSPRAWMCGSMRGYERTPWRSALGQQNSAGSACKMCVGFPCGRGRWALPGLRGGGCAGMYVYVVPRCWRWHTDAWVITLLCERCMYVLPTVCRRPAWVRGCARRARIGWYMSVCMCMYRAALVWSTVCARGVLQSL